MNQTQKTSHKRILQADAAGTQAIFQAGTAGTQAIFQAGTAGTQAIFQAGTAVRLRYNDLRIRLTTIRGSMCYIPCERYTTPKTNRKTTQQTDATGTQAVFQAGTAARFRYYDCIRHTTVPIRNEPHLSLRCQLVILPQMSQLPIRGLPSVLPNQDILSLIRDISTAHARLQQDGVCRVVN